MAVPLRFPRYKLRRLVLEIRRTADNVSPRRDDGTGGDVYPANEMRKWATAIERCLEALGSS